MRGARASPPVSGNKYNKFNSNNHANSKYINYVTNSSCSNGEFSPLSVSDDYFSPRSECILPECNKTVTNSNSGFWNIWLNMCYTQYAYFTKWLELNVSPYIPDVLINDFKKLCKHRLCSNIILIIVVLTILFYVLALINLFAGIDISRLVSGKHTLPVHGNRRVVWV